jgi:hypothetical protein
MGDSQQPKKAAFPFEVPDLELAPARRASSKAVPVQAENRRMEYGGLNLFDEEAFTAGSPSLELGGAHEPSPTQGFEVDFDAPGGVELRDDRVASDTRGGEPRPSNAEPPPFTSDEIRILANYGEVPTSAYLAPAYAYRVLRRKRELRRALRGLYGEHARAKLTREHTERSSGDEAATRRATEHEQALAHRSELHARALDAYDRQRVAQGVRLACTAGAIIVLLILLKFAL